jgi:hypothetical protein
MDVDEARERLAKAEQLFAGGADADAVAIYGAVISRLVRDDAGRGQLIRAYQGLIDLQLSQGGFLRALRTFRQYLDRDAPACDPVYDRIYCDGLLATQTPPVPFRRRERFFSLVQLLRRALPPAGLIAECGCYRGLSSYILCRYIKLADQRFDGHGYRIFDSFAGLSEPQPEDAVGEREPQAPMLKQISRRGQFAARLEEVRTALNSFPGVEFYPGWIPEAFPAEPGARYSFVHLDVDLYQPTRDSLEYFYPRLVPGGSIVCDDFNWPGARKAIEDFCASVKAEFTPTPFQQAHIARRA